MYDLVLEAISKHIEDKYKLNAYIVLGYIRVAVSDRKYIGSLYIGEYLVEIDRQHKLNLANPDMIKDIDTFIESYL